MGPPEGPVGWADCLYVHSAVEIVTSIPHSVSFLWILYSFSQKHSVVFWYVHRPQLYRGMVKTIPYIDKG